MMDARRLPSRFDRYTTKPIPSRTTDVEAARHTAILECCEPMVRSDQLIRHEPRYFEAGLPGTSSACWVREGILSALLQANKLLAPDLELVTFDGWRSLECQATIFDSFRKEIRADNPTLSEEEILQKTSVFASPPRWDPTCPPFHSTGAAIDMTLAWKNGPLLDLGTDFDDLTDLAGTAAFEGSDHPARLSRRLLFWLLDQLGFENLSQEWWHFDRFGQLWAFQRPGTICRYGIVDDPISLEPESAIAS